MSGRSSSLACYLVGRAARKAPPGLAARLEEEWQADLMARRGALSRICFGLGCCWATRIIAREFGAAAAAAGSSTSGQRLLVGYGGHDLSGFSRRTTAIIAIACLHLGIFYLYLTGFTRTSVVKPADPITGKFITEQHNPDRPTPLRPTQIMPTTFDDVPLPDLTFKIPAAATAITVIRTPQPVGPAQLPPQPVNRVLGGPGAAFPDTDDYYPPDVRREDEMGTAAVSVCVDPRGRLTAAPTIVTSSGIGQLDAGALRLARAGSGHYRPTTENGRPVSSCYAFRVKFQLADP
ncbi:MAG TPA: TonB family protein [Steroidobacteraceae bacterium]|jgi:TonB family protein